MNATSGNSLRERITLMLSKIPQRTYIASRHRPPNRAEGEQQVPGDDLAVTLIDSTASPIFMWTRRPSANSWCGVNNFLFGTITY